MRYLIAMALLVCTNRISAGQTSARESDKVSQFWNRLSAARTVSYRVKLWGQDLMTAPTAERSIFVVYNTYDVKAQRPNKINIAVSPGLEREETVNGKTRKQFCYDVGAIYINDGKSSVNIMTGLPVYFSGTGMTRLGNDKNDAAPNVATLDVFDDMPMARYLPVAAPNNVAPRQIVFTRKGSGASQHSEERLYFDSGTGFLSRYSLYHQNGDGTMKEIERREYGFWEFNTKFSPGTFVVRPPLHYLSDADYQRKIDSAQSLHK